MMGLGFAAMAASAWILWTLRKGRLPREGARSTRWLLWTAIVLPLLPLFANSFGWIFTEMGRQPWVVFGLMTTPNAVSPGVSAGEVLTSLITYTLLYGVLAVIEIGLMLHYVRLGADPFEEPPDPKLGETDDKPLAFAY